MAVTPFETRTRLFVAGQASWPDPDRFPNKNCVSCANYRLTNSLGRVSKHGGFCSLVKALTRKDGQPFNGQTAMACSQYGRQL